MPLDSEVYPSSDFFLVWRSPVGLRSLSFIIDRGIRQKRDGYDQKEMEPKVGINKQERMGFREA